MNHRKYAKRLFVHYMRLAFNETGLEVTQDNVAEWEDIVDSIINAAIQEFKEQYINVKPKRD